jgi:hypothetical protein
MNELSAFLKPMEWQRLTVLCWDLTRHSRRSMASRRQAVTPSSSHSEQPQHSPDTAATCNALNCSSTVGARRMAVRRRPRLDKLSLPPICSSTPAQQTIMNGGVYNATFGIATRPAPRLHVRRAMFRLD